MRTLARKVLGLVALLWLAGFVLGGLLFLGGSFAQAWATYPPRGHSSALAELVAENGIGLIFISLIGSFVGAPCGLLWLALTLTSFRKQMATVERHSRGDAPHAGPQPGDGRAKQVSDSGHRWLG